MERFYGIIIGIICFVSIGVWHPIVIKGEYHLGKKICIPIFAVIGILCIILSLTPTSLVLSVGFAVFGFSALWGIGEVIHQEKRVEKGWFPKKEKKSQNHDGRQ